MKTSLTDNAEKWTVRYTYKKIIKIIEGMCFTERTRRYTHFPGTWIVALKDGYQIFYKDPSNYKRKFLNWQY